MIGVFLLGLLIGVVFTAILILAWPMSADEKREFEEFQRFQRSRER